MYYVFFSFLHSRRGLTPPHRVKSISMATFTPEEIEIMQSRGNQVNNCALKTFFALSVKFDQLRRKILNYLQYCKHVWLGLYDSEIPTSDEQQIKDFMVAKYEKKR